MKIKEILKVPVPESISPLDVRQPIKREIGTTKKKQQAKKTVEQLRPR